MDKMKKRVSLLLWALVALMVSCNSDTEAHYFGEYGDLQPGFTIYRAANNQQLVSLDPTAVAIRLAMLLDEAKSQDRPLEEVEVRIGERDYLLKDLLFGRSVQIEAIETPATADSSTEADNEPTPRISGYRITYAGSAPASIDSFRRVGSYLILMQGGSLTETSQADPWRVSVDGEMLLSSGSAVDERFLLTAGETELYATHAGSYAIALDGLRASFESTTQYTSSWSGHFTLTTSTVTGDLSYTNHMRDTYALWGEAEGPTFYAFNNRSNTQMRYTVTERDRLIWDPTLTNSFVQAKEGVEQVRLTHAEEYPAELYPSPEVRVQRTYKEGTLSYTLHYNGQSVEF